MDPGDPSHAGYRPGVYIHGGPPMEQPVSPTAVGHAYADWHDLSVAQSSLDPPAVDIASDLASQARDLDSDDQLQAPALAFRPVSIQPNRPITYHEVTIDPEGAGRITLRIREPRPQTILFRVSTECRTMACIATNTESREEVEFSVRDVEAINALEHVLGALHDKANGHNFTSPVGELPGVVLAYVVFFADRLGIRAAMMVQLDRWAAAIRVQQRRDILTTRGDWEYLWYVAHMTSDRELYALVVKTLLVCCCFDSKGHHRDASGRHIRKVPVELNKYASKMRKYPGAALGNENSG